MIGPQKDETPAGDAAQGCRGLAQSVSLNFAASAADDKNFYTFRARLRLVGHALSQTEASDGPRRYMASRWGMMRELRDLCAVEAFAKQVAA